MRNDVNYLSFKTSFENILLHITSLISVGAGRARARKFRAALASAISKDSVELKCYNSFLKILKVSSKHQTGVLNFTFT